MDSLNVADVEQAIQDLNLDTRIIEFDESTATAQQAADNIGCELGQIVKSLAFIINKDAAILVLVSGDQVADDRKIATLFQVGRKKVRMATAEQCVEIYGYMPGGVPPIGHRTPDIPVYIDDTFKRYEQVYAAAGSSRSIFPILLQDLVTATNGTFADVVK